MNKIKIITSLVIVSLVLGINGFTNAQVRDTDPLKTINRINGTPSTAAATAVKSKTAVQTPTASNYLSVSPLSVVQQPKFYLGKNIKFTAKFDKFSNLGLDYKPAFRSSEKYISLLVQRPDVTSNDIPLSELKIFVERESAEKYIDLNAGDEIEVSGHIFSVALGDPWMTVDEFKVIKTAPAKIIK